MEKEIAKKAKERKSVSRATDSRVFVFKLRDNSMCKVPKLLHVSKEKNTSTDVVLVINT